VRAFLIDLLTLTAGLVIALVIPVVYSDELHWTLAWERSLLPPDTGQERSGEGAIPVVVTTDRGFVRLDARNGDLLASGLRADVFTAGDRWFVNQRADAPRWAVQRWDGGAAQFFDASGVPRIEGTYLVEELPSGGIVGSPLEPSVQPGEIILGGADGVVTYDICTSCEPPILIRGSLFGAVEIGRPGETGRVVHRVPAEPFGGDVPIVYGVSVFSDDRYVVVSGIDPQTVSLISSETDDAGGATAEGTVTTDLLEVPREMTVRHPIASVMVGGNLVIPLVDGLVVVSEDSAEIVRDIPGGFSVLGGGIWGATLLLGGNAGEDGAVALISRERPGTTVWRWSGAILSDIVDVDSTPTVVLRGDDSVIALEFGL